MSKVSSYRKILNMVNKKYDKALSFLVANIVEKKHIRKLKSNTTITINKEKEDIWVSKWGVLGKAKKDYYRVYSAYVGDLPEICPDDLCHNNIEPILNPVRYRSYYSDKNMFDRIIGIPDVTAFTYLRNINGVYYDRNYNILDADKAWSALNAINESVVVKPSVDSSSGNKVVFFDVSDGNLLEMRGQCEVLSLELLQRMYGKNYIVQKCVKQSPYMAQFCNTSVNTIRMAAYKSVVSNESHILKSILRFGKNGSWVDNAHAGGAFAGVMDDGTLMDYCIDQYGNKQTDFNGINFVNQQFVIPNFDCVKGFAKRIIDQVPHLRLLALDIMLDENNRPVLIEYNCNGFSLWLFQLTSGPAFGKYADEIIEYCKRHANESSRIYIEY